MTKAPKAEGPWTEPVMVKEGKGIIDTCPLWDEDGKVYLVHGVSPPSHLWKRPRTGWTI